MNDEFTTLRRLFLAAYSETHESGMEGLHAACTEQIAVKYRTDTPWEKMYHLADEMVCVSQMNNLVGWVM